MGAWTAAHFKTKVERKGGSVVDAFRSKGKRIDGE